MIRVLLDIAFLFLKLGFTAFGGPAAHIALLQEEVVRRRQWMDSAYFLDLIGVTNLVPGPNSTEMVMQCGMHRGGFLGLFIAGVCFITPAAFLSTLFAYVYQEYAALPSFEHALSGLRPVVCVIIAVAVYRLGRQAVKNRTLMILTIMVLVYALGGGSEIVGILVGGLGGMLWMRRKDMLNVHWAIIPVSLTAVPASALAALNLSSMFWSFMKIGATFFGGGYTILAYFQDEFVHRLGWLSHQQVLDAVAVGQLTPGPVLSSAAFLGYQLFGVQGAALATVGIFLPSFMIVALIHPWMSKLRQSSWLAAFLDAVNVSAVAVMSAVAISMSGSVLIDVKSFSIALVSLILIVCFSRISQIWWMAAGAAAGWIFY